MPINDPYLYYAMNDADISGATITDRGSGGNNGTLVNSPTSTTGQILQARLFVPASTQSITTPITDATFGGDTAGTIAWWQKPSTAHNSGAIRGIWGQTSGASEFTCQVWSDNNWYVGWNASGDRRVTLAATAGNYPSGVWSHYAFVWSASGSILYRNGSSIGTNVNAPVSQNLNAVFRIAKKGEQAQFFPGAIDEFRKYRRALSAADVMQLYLFNGFLRRGLSARIGSRRAV